MKFNGRFLEVFDFDKPSEEKYKGFCDFVRKHYQDQALVLIDDTDSVYTAFTPFHVLIYSKFEKTAVKREVLLPMNLLYSSSVKGSFFGKVYIMHGANKYVLGSFVDTSHYVGVVKAAIEGRQDLYRKMSKITLKRWLDDAFATLVVTIDKAYIKYIFQCNDRRYNPHIKIIDEEDIDFYIQSWQEVFDVYEKSKKKFKKTHFLEQGYSTGLIVKVNMYDEGVKLDVWDGSITTREELNDIIRDYKKAKFLIPKLRKQIREMAEKQ